MTETYHDTIDLLMFDSEQNLVSARTLYVTPECGSHVGVTSRYREYLQSLKTVFGEPDFERPIGSSWTECRWDPKREHDKTVKLVISWEVPDYHLREIA